MVPFPYADRLAEKRRPALVISADALVHDHGLLWMAMITSTRINRWTSDVEIADLTAAGLPIPSRIRVAKITTVEPSRLSKRLGRLSIADAQAALLGLSRFIPR